MSLLKFRETVNLFLFKSKERNLRYLQLISLCFCGFAIGSMIRYYGFPKTLATEEAHLTVINISFGFYIVNYIIRFLYSFEPKVFLRTTRIELTMLLLVVIDALMLQFANLPFIHQFFSSINQTNFHDYSIIFIQLYLLILVVMEIGKATSGLSKINISAAGLFNISFIFIISMGSLFLSLPEMTTDGKGLPAIDAIFISTSACCVTGLSTIDVANLLSFKGQLVLIFLIQIGGLNMITFATFFASFTQKGLGLKHHAIIMDFFSTEDLFNTKVLLKQVLFWTITIEVIGTTLIFMFWDHRIEFRNVGQKIFFSLFHSVSAFNNAGFSLFTHGLMEAFVYDAYIIQIVIMALIFFGSLGFPAIYDMFGIRNILQRRKLKWKQYNISTKIALYSSIILIVLGAVTFYFLEKDNAFKDLSIEGKIVSSLFAAVTPRTAGFNTFDYEVITLPAIVLTIVLMFIGASSGGTGGGIKTSTFVLLATSAFATIRGKKNLELFRQRISFDLLNKAFSIVLFSTFVIFIGLFLLTITEKGVAFDKLFFEVVSAFGTVGLSMNLTPHLTIYGKIIIIITMFIGRVGILTLANSLSKPTATNKYRYPEAHFMVG